MTRDKTKSKLLRIKKNKKKKILSDFSLLEAKWQDFFIFYQIIKCH